jgi:hypothetical protein
MYKREMKATAAKLKHVNNEVGLLKLITAEQ